MRVIGERWGVCVVHVRMTGAGQVHTGDGEHCRGWGSRCTSCRKLETGCMCGLTHTHAGTTILTGKCL